MPIAIIRMTFRTNKPNIWVLGRIGGIEGDGL